MPAGISSKRPIITRSTLTPGCTSKSALRRADQKLSVIEKNFAEKQKVLREKIHVGNLELAAAMLEDKAFSERVAAAVERIHHAQGELQKLTIEHIFDMQTVLTPQQAEKLNKLAADALVQNP
jgi:Spy/CpxP family protein refolding chaperone